MSKKPTPLTRHVTAVFRSASPEQVTAALDWYEDARTVAASLAATNNVSVEVAAGVIAALSPLQSWGANVNLAARFLSTPGGLTRGYLRVGLEKARAIVEGTDPLAVLVSPKIRAFYLGILHAGATDAVCIDRHAYDIAVNERRNDDTRDRLTARQYEAVAEVYKRAARILSREVGYPMSAAQVQAVTWKVWRARFWSEGAYDRHSVAI